MFIIIIIIQSCSKAYEYQGFMMENEQRYTDAALHYELAWKYTSMMDPAIGENFLSFLCKFKIILRFYYSFLPIVFAGFRLAFNCLKCKNNTRAVDVCHQVCDAIKLRL